MFKYSERPGTTASRRFPDDVPESVKKERIIRLVDQQKQISLKSNQAHIGSVQSILVEKDVANKDNTLLIGRNEYNTIVKFPRIENVVVGDYVNIRLTEATPHALLGIAVI